MMLLDISGSRREEITKMKWTDVVKKYIMYLCPTKFEEKKRKKNKGSGLHRQMGIIIQRRDLDKL